MATTPRAAFSALLLIAGAMLLTISVATPQRAPASTASDLLFSGSRISDFEANQSAPGAVSEAPDPTGGSGRALQMTVGDDDVAPITPTSSPRAQLTTPSVIDPGDEFWWSGRFYLPENFPGKVPQWLNVIEGAYGAPFDGTPPFEIEVVGDQLRWQRNDTYDWDIPWEMPLVRGRWISYLVHQRFAADGFVELWIDGQQVTFFEDSSNNPNREAPTQHLEMATRDHSNDGGPNFLVLQNYREARMFGSVTLYHGATRVGPTRDSVEAAAPAVTILRRGVAIRKIHRPHSGSLQLGVAERTSAPEALARVR